MPWHDYRCESCQIVWTDRTPEEAAENCQLCKQPLEQLISLPSPHVWRGSTEGAMPKGKK